MEATNFISTIVTSVIFLIYISTIQKRVENLEKEIKEIKYNYTDRFEDIKDEIHKLDVKIEKIVSKFCNE